jgi:hypothetical protein
VCADVNSVFEIMKKTTPSTLTRPTSLEMLLTGDSAQNPSQRSVSVTAIYRQPAFLDTANSTAFIDLPEVSPKWAANDGFSAALVRNLVSEGAIRIKTLSH